MRRCHVMPFGAELTATGARFRLWAPAAQQVRLCLGDGRQEPMDAVGGGFFERHCEGIGAGLRYGFQIDCSGPVVPDPASRFNPDDVHAMSELVDPEAFAWQDGDWHGRPWRDAVIYELHVGAFTDAGSFDAVARRLDYLAALGVTALELMPVADFPGRRGWGYDGVLPFAPEASYGRPEDLKRLVEAAHAAGLMVFLDVVYNHFGPDGNYLHRYAPQFFTGRVATPWGQAIDFENGVSAPVREFFIHNALYWLEEFHVDGLRLDAVHAIHDRSTPDFLEELAQRVRAELPADRHVHLVLENDNNASRYLRHSDNGPGYDAQWNDDFHHAMHVLLTAEDHGYYLDYADAPDEHLARCLAEGFAYQGEHSHFRDRPRGEPSAALPSSAFVNFLQNHDQVGNRALGERLTEFADTEALAAAHVLLLLAPQPPMLFMGEEFAASARFPYFCDYTGELGRAVAEGRRKEFWRFPEFSDPEAQARIPDPNDPATYAQAKLNWAELDQGLHRETLGRCRQLLALRHRWLTPRLPARLCNSHQPAADVLELRWRLAGGGRWTMLANLGGRRIDCGRPAGQAVYLSAGPASDPAHLPAWSVAVFFQG
jgi:maltooligosyltrehalose trehalohydrolase